LEVPAFAKINLTLEVLGRRDDGYHEVRTILQTVDLADWLDIQPAPALLVECDDTTLSGEANLVWRAAVALAQRYGIEPKARIFIRKEIPAGMGLGGGSSDAAAALAALNRLWGLSLSREELAQVAADVGSDVPFFLWGGTALAEGRGERITPLRPLAPVSVLLICPNVTIPNKTARLYSRVTPAHYSNGGTTRRALKTLMAGQSVVDSIYNAFEEVAFQEFPGLGQLRRRIEELSVALPHLSGAGPALFCLPSSEEEHQRVTKALQYDVKAYLVDVTGGSPHPFNPHPNLSPYEGGRN
jgi:4-diphosphocytidyl-2-C-methyl-D-erythritol kinase